MLDRLPDELLLRVCCASDRPTLVAATSREVRAQLPRLAPPPDAWRLNHEAPGDEVVTDVWSAGGVPAVRGQMLVRVGPEDAGRASLARHVADLHARLRGGRDCAQQAACVVRDALGPGQHATSARVGAVRYLAWLGRRFACIEAAVPRNLTHLGLAADALVCREALAVGWGTPSDWAAVMVVLSGASDMRPDLDGRKAAALAVVLGGAPDALVDAAYRTTAVGACIDGGLVRSLRVLLDASARHTTPADLRGYVVRAAEASDDAVLDEVMRRVGGPPTADGRAAIGRALVVAAENDRVAACRVLLAHPWVEEPATASVVAGAALVACSRLNRVAAAQLMCTRAPPSRDVDRALETSSHWDFLLLTRALLLAARPSVAALGRGLWVAALHGATDTVACLRAALAHRWDGSRAAVQRALDAALDAAASARSPAAVRAMLVPGGPGPSPRAQADALRSACFAGEGELVRALLSEPLTRTMNRNTLNACFLESARRHDLATVRALVGLVREPVVAEGLRCVMVANDQELTAVLLTAATRPVSSAGLRRAALAALAAGVGLTIRTLLDECGPSRRAELESAVAAALPLDATSATPEYRAVATLVREGAADELLVGDVWRTMLRVAAEAADVDVLRVVAARAPSAPDERDVAAACRAMEAVVRAGDVDLVEMLAPAFGRLASVDAVDHAFLVATAWGTRGDTGALHMLARHFRPSRSAVRRCRLLLAPLDRRRAAPATAALAQMQRR